MNFLIKAGPSCLLAAYTVKLVIFGAGIPDSLIVAALGALTALSSFIEYIKYKTTIQESIEKFNTELKTQKDALSAQDEQVKVAISYVTNLKLKSSLTGR